MIATPSFEWTEERVLSLPPGEFDFLEFKDSRKAENANFERDLSKGISALANTNGGQLILGVRDPNASNKVEIDGGIPLDFKNGFKEWLENIIPRLTSPPVLGFNVYPVLSRSDGIQSQIKEGHAVLVIDVPASEHPPHQAKDYVYYVRSGSKNRPLDHIQIMSLLQTQTIPRARTKVSIQPYRDRDATMSIAITNEGRRIIRDYQFDVYIPTFLEGLGCMSCEAVPFSHHDGQTWLHFRLSAVNSALFPGATLFQKYRLVSEGGINDEAHNESLFYSYNLWIENLPVQSGSEPVTTIIAERLTFQN